MRPSDEFIRRVVFEAGYVRGMPVTETDVIAWATGFARAAIKACEDVASHYRPTYPFGIDPMTIPDHMAQAAAKNCARMIQAQFGMAEDNDDGGQSTEVDNERAETWKEA